VVAVCNKDERVLWRGEREWKGSSWFVLGVLLEEGGGVFCVEFGGEIGKVGRFNEGWEVRVLV
jgi:hypothetical protein